MEEILSNDIIRIREDNGTSRPRRFQARKNLFPVIPKSGVTAVENRTLLQPPSPSANDTSIVEDNITTETQELISILKLTHKWSNNNKSIGNPLFRYLTLKNHKDKG